MPVGANTSAWIYAAYAIIGLLVAVVIGTAALVVHPATAIRVDWAAAATLAAVAAVFVFLKLLLDSLPATARSKQ